MKIAVCMNFVPDTASKIKLNDKGEIDLSGLTFVINPYDEFAIEEAIKLKDKLQAETLVISIGPDNNKEGLKKALAMGIDNAVHIKYENFLDSFAAAKLLSDCIKQKECDIVLTGKQSVDFDNAITGIYIAEMLNYNCISVVTKLQIENNIVIAEREVEGGKEIVESKLPIVITAQKGLNEPRYASLKGIMAAKKKIIEEIIPQNVDNIIEVLSSYLPKGKNPGRILGSDASAAVELVKLLREEAKVI